MFFCAFLGDMGERGCMSSYYSWCDNRTDRRVVTSVSCIRKTSPSVFNHSKLSGISKEPESQEVLTEFMENGGPQGARPHPAIHLLTLWLLRSVWSLLP